MATPKALRWFVESMVGYWVLLLLVSFGAAAAIYGLWFRGRI